MDGITRIEKWQISEKRKEKMFKIPKNKRKNNWKICYNIRYMAKNIEKNYKNRQKIACKSII